MPWLITHRKDVFSQCGDDGVLEIIFDRIGEGKKWCCEFGAWDGIWLSNTYNRIANYGWSGVLIEPDQEKFLQLKTNMEKFVNVIPVNAAVEATEVANPNFGANSLDAILGRTPIPRDFDLLSIDVDGPDYWIWKSLENYQPRVVIIEVTDHPLGLDARKIYEYGQPGGSTILPMVELAKQKGYELACVTGNAIFVLRELCEKLDIDPDNWQKLVIKEVSSDEWRASAPKAGLL